MKKSILTSLIFAILINVNGFAQGESTNLLPSEVHTLMLNAVEMQPNKKRLDATKPYVKRAITDNISREEQFYLGEIYFWNFMPKEGYDIYSKFLEGNDYLSRASWQRAMQIDFRAFDKHDKVEKDILAFRKKFKPIVNDRLYMFGQVYNVATQYATNGNHEKALQLVADELASLNYDGAYDSFRLPAFFVKSYKELGKVSVAIAQMEKAKAGLEKTLETRKNNIPENDPDYPLKSSRTKYMETIMTSNYSYSQMNDKFEELIQLLDSYITKAKESIANSD